MFVILRKLAVGVVLTLLSVLAQAQYSNIFVFGDSLSDNGNLRAVTQNPQIPERFTDGPVAMELVAANFGLALTPSLHLLPPEVTGGQYGNNYAIAGAIAIDEDGDPQTADINLPTQVNAFLAINGGVAPSDALYVVFIGGNDLFDAQDLLLAGGYNGTLDATQRIRQATRSVEQQLKTLIAAGAEHILVVNAPDVGATPITDIKQLQALQNASTLGDYLLAYNLPSISRFLSAVYNTGINYRVAKVEYETGVDIAQFNLFGFLDDIIANADEYGYTNTTDACIFLQTQGGTPNPACDFSSFVFFDEIHPTAITHQRAAAAVVNGLSD